MLSLNLLVMLMHFDNFLLFIPLYYSLSFVIEKRLRLLKYGHKFVSKEWLN